MKSFKMKALSLAVLGLAGFGMAGAAFGQTVTVGSNTCPDPTYKSNQGYATPNGPWAAEVRH